MLKLCLGDIADAAKRAEWDAAGVKLPRFDCSAMRGETMADPVWLHFGVGNIFRSFVAPLSQKLLDKGLCGRGVVAVEPFDYEIVDKIYEPYDNLSLLAGLKPDGACDYELTASIAGALKADFSDEAQAAAIRKIFRSPGLQLVSLTITEKGYALKGIDGSFLPVAARDIESGPDGGGADGREGGGNSDRAGGGADGREGGGNSDRAGGGADGREGGGNSDRAGDGADGREGNGNSDRAGDGADGREGGCNGARADEQSRGGAPARPKPPLRHCMSILAAMLLERYRAGAYPVAIVSMDNFSHNGAQLKASVLEIARAWQRKGFVGEGFAGYLGDEGKVAFPWTMIDKITPRPAESVRRRLASAGLDLPPVVTDKGTFIAAFVNAEIPQYLVVEDSFPNGRPPLEEAGVLFADRETVNNVERMKVTTCLNPLHTALAVFGCLLGYKLIADEMRDAGLRGLVERIGYDEGMPVVPAQSVIDPSAFLREVLTERLPNPFMPDTPQRIATDTSLKLSIRYGETIKSYMARDDLDARRLACIPLVLAAWCRYLL
ncbi:MAG: mannitol dehydrogenase family protein, partial [Clostridiales bacterium]|nr:mannitol dehydrogenase family protein [Clostridiales bacterium]